MKKLLTLTLAIGMTFLATAQDDSKKLPSVDLKTMEGKSINTSSLSNDGKPMIISFWATWCKPCVSAIPKMNIIYNEFSDKGIQFIGVNVDGPRNQAKVKPFANSLDIKYPIVLDHWPGNIFFIGSAG